MLIMGFSAFLCAKAQVGAEVHGCTALRRYSRAIERNSTEIS